MTGLPETWLVEAHYSFASVEDLDQRIAALAPVRAFSDAADPLQDDVLAPSRTMLALFRPNWSYRPDQAIRMFPRARYFQISLFRIRPGTEAEFGELIRLRRATADVVNLDRPDMAYRDLRCAGRDVRLPLADYIAAQFRRRSESGARVRRRVGECQGKGR